VLTHGCDEVKIKHSSSSAFCVPCHVASHTDGHSHPPSTLELNCLHGNIIQCAEMPRSAMPSLCRLQVMMQELRREVAILQRVSADANVVQFYGAVLPDGSSAASPAMLVMEYLAVSGYWQCFACNLHGRAGSGLSAQYCHLCDRLGCLAVRQHCRHRTPGQRKFFRCPQLIMILRYSSCTPHRHASHEHE
jgi:hypothetical protein